MRQSNQTLIFNYIVIEIKSEMKITYNHVQEIDKVKLTATFPAENIFTIKDIEEL